MECGFSEFFGAFSGGVFIHHTFQLRKGCPALQITAEGEYARLCTFLESMLTQIWCVVSPSTPPRLLMYTTRYGNPSFQNV